MDKRIKNTDLLEKAIRYDRNRSLLWALFLLPMAVFLMRFYKLDNFAGYALPATGFACLLIAFQLFYEVFKAREISLHPLFDIMSHRNEKIVWVYSVITEVAPFGIQLFSSGQFFIKLDDRQEFCFSLPIDQLQALSESLNKLLPHTTFGYSPENDQWYEVDPILLRK